MPQRSVSICPPSSACFIVLKSRVNPRILIFIPFLLGSTFSPAATVNITHTMVTNLTEPVGANFAVRGGNGAAFGFTTGATTGQLWSIRLSFDSGTAGSPGFVAGLYSGIGSTGPTDLITSLSGPAQPVVAGEYDYQPLTYTLLYPNTTYWIGAASTSGSYPLRLTLSDGEMGYPGWSIGNTMWSFPSGEAPQEIEAAGQFAVNMIMTSVPEPSTYAAIFGGVALAVALVWRRRKITVA